MKRYLIIVFMAVLLSSLLAISPAEVHTKLVNAYNRISSFQAGVSQTNNYSSLKRTITYQGNIYYVPGKMLMHFTRPQIQRLQIDNGKITMYDAMSNTILRGDMQPQFAGMNPIQLLQEYWGKSTVSVVSENRSNATVRLIPRNDPMIREIRAQISRISGLVQNLSYIESSGNTVSYAFSNIRTNQSIPASVWTYRYPADAQVLNQ